MAQNVPMSQVFNILLRFVCIYFCLSSVCVHAATPASPVEHGHRNKTKEFRVGLLLPGDPLPMVDSNGLPTLPYNNNPRYPFFMQMVRPATDIAVETVERDILPNHHIELFAEDTECRLETAELHVATQFYEESINCFIGPACVFAAGPVARFTNHWQVPFITAGALSFFFRKFDTVMTQMQGDYLKHTQLIFQILPYFNWSDIVVIYHLEESEHDNYKFQCEALVQTLYDKGEEYPVTFLALPVLGHDPEDVLKEQIKELLGEYTKPNSREILRSVRYKWPK